MVQKTMNYTVISVLKVIFGWMLKNNPIPLNSQLVGHIESIDPHAYWQSRATWTSIHSSVTPSQRGGAVNSTAVMQQPPQQISPTGPIHHESINILKALIPLRQQYYVRPLMTIQV